MSKQKIVTAIVACPRKSTLKALKRWQQPPETWQEPPFQAHSKTACFQRSGSPEPLEKAVSEALESVLANVELEFHDIAVLHHVVAAFLA